MLPDKYVEMGVCCFEIILYRVVFGGFIEMIAYLQVTELYVFYLYHDSVVYIFNVVYLPQLKYFLVHVWEVS